MAVALVALHIHIGQEVHFDLDHAIALTGLTAAALDVEAEPAGLIAPRLGFWQAGEPVPNGGEGPGIGRRVGSRRAPDGRLVDIDDLVQELRSLDLVMQAGMRPCPHQAARQSPLHGFNDQG